MAADKDADDALGKTTTLISSIADNSNITLDPDLDAYFVGDILVNQTTGALTQVSALLSAASTLESGKNDDNKIAYVEARDGFAASTGNIATELGKAIKGNVDGSVKAALAADGEAVAAAADKLLTISKTNDHAALRIAAEDVSRKMHALTFKADDQMEKLLNSRNAGFRNIIIERLGIALLVVLAGVALSFTVVRSITRPVTSINLPHGQADTWRSQRCCT